MFNLRCNGLGGYTSQPYSSISLFGGPILYLVLQIVAGFSFLVWYDSGRPLPAFLRHNHLKSGNMSVNTADKGDDVLQELSGDVLDEKERLKESGDMLRVLGLTKRYPRAPRGQLAVNDVSFGTQLGEVFACIGPNGAGKTTTFACIRGTVRLMALFYLRVRRG